MDLKIKDHLFVITGATSGLGRSIADALILEGAQVIINARNENNLIAFANNYPDQIEYLVGDITTDATLSQLILKIDKRPLSGMVINAGGPPPKTFANTKMDDWDNAYKNLLRWKIKLTQEIMPLFKKAHYGRFLFIESASVKQPIDNLILSTSLRLAVVGFVKSLSREVANQGISLNILAPGYHATPRMEELYKIKAHKLGVSPEDIKEEFKSQTLTGKMGDPDQFASLAVWLLSPLSTYITGQTITVDGGLVKGIFS